MGDAFLRQNIKEDNRLDGSNPAKAALSGFQLAQDFPNLPSGYYWIKSESMPNALEMYVDMVEDGGGYDFYPFNGNGISTTFVTQAHSGTPLGLQLVYPRSRGNWTAMGKFVRDVLGNTTTTNFNRYFLTTYAITKPGGGGNYTSFIMRNPAFYGTGAPDWRVPDNGRWWLRDSTFGEPNGDYTGNAFLGMSSASYPRISSQFGVNNLTGELGFNDGTSSYSTGGFYLVSTNAKP